MKAIQEKGQEFMRVLLLVARELRGKAAYLGLGVKKKKNFWKYECLSKRTVLYQKCSQIHRLGSEPNTQNFSENVPIFLTEGCPGIYLERPWGDVAVFA